MSTISFAQCVDGWERMLEHYEQCIAYADEKRIALIAGDAQMVATLTVREQQTIERIEASMAVMRDIFAANGTSKDWSWDQVMSLCTTEEERAYGERVRDQLRGVLIELSSKNELNVILLRQALDDVHRTLDLIAGTVRDGTYTAPMHPRQTSGRAFRFEWRA
ncbi:MAG: flagellar export chaperone FlgN [Paenibacillaceae bacterium]|jgi:hypothetical protein|nr:flagellar export chaperone FlgN [Paenibacillaceae bacterium]